jgi:hypothetical protein
MANALRFALPGMTGLIPSCLSELRNELPSHTSILACQVIVVQLLIQQLLFYP